MKALARLSAGTVVSLFFFTLLFGGFSGLAHAYTSPGKPSGYVNDFAGMLSPSTKAELNAALAQFTKETTSEISVVTISSLQGDAIEEYANQLLREWGIGTKEKNNGALLLISKEDRQMRIEVGYGLEGALTDAESSSIVNNILRPAFRAEKYDEGVKAAVSAMVVATKSEYVAPASSGSSENGNNKVGSLIQGLFPFLVALVLWIVSSLARSKSWWLGGVFGGVIGIVIGFVAQSFLIGLIFVLVLIPMGLLFDYIVSKAYSRSKSSGKSMPWWIGGGGFGGG